MKDTTNHFKASLHRGDVQIGLWCSLCSEIAAEALSLVGFDWLLFDSEHSPVEVSGLAPLLRAASGTNTRLAVRPAWNDQTLIKRTLDIGAQNLLLPFVQTADEAKQAVSSCRYPPEGVRGVAGATRASKYGFNQSYFSTANNDVCILVQIETTQAIDALPAIASVSGVDGVFVGPSDLAASMGFLGTPSAPPVQEAIQGAVGAIKKAGKAPGILAPSVDEAKRYLDWGYQFVACGVDVRLLTSAASDLNSSFKT